MQNSRAQRIYSQFPDPVEGYELNPDYGQYSVIIPEATTNLIINPSFEYGNTNFYAAIGGAIALTYNWQAYGAAGMSMTPAISTESGARFGTVSLTSGTTYTFSVTIQGEENKIYYVWFATNAGALIGTKRKWIGTGHKQRIWVTYTETSSTTRYLYVTRDAKYSDQHLFYADGFQLEAKAYPTTYCDGDMLGFVKNETPAPYLWTGTPGTSTSTRSAQTRSGGREVNLLDLGLHILAVIGLGMAPLVDQSLPMPGRGELAQGTGTTAREFTLVSALNFDNPRHGEALRSDLIDAFKPDATLIDQTMILRYQACDDDGDPTGDSLDILCKYRSGLEGNITNNNQERLALNFKMHLPLIRSTYSGGATLGYQTTVANANYILKRDGATGLWQEMAAGTSGPVQAIAQGRDGSIYVGGLFGLAGGVANTLDIAKWSNGAWSALGTGLNNTVSAMAVGPDGSLYVGGDFTDAGGVAAADYIAKWDGVNWTALGTGANGSVTALIITSDGSLYAGGAFTSMGGVANTKNIAKWNGTTWAAVGTGGFNGTVYALAQDFAGGPNLYAGGLFTSADGVIGTTNVAKWDGANWVSMGEFGANAVVYTLTSSPNGSIYAGGAFTIIGGVYANRFARWNGTIWSQIYIGMNNNVLSVVTSPDNSIYAGGIFTTAGGIIPPDSMAVWTGSDYLPVDINLPGAATVLKLFFDRDNNLYIGYNTNGNAVSATVSVPNVGSSTAYPTFYFTGPGTIYQIKNYTTGKSIFFNVTLLAGETATLNLDPANISFKSSFQGALPILEGSDTLFPLIPGVNNISAYIFGGTTAATAVSMSWIGQFWSKDGAVFK